MNTCSTCKAFLLDDGEDLGSCQLHPPILVGDAFMFPGVHPFAWCLDWQAKYDSETIAKLAARRA